jgi:hypothetical protein
MLVTRESSGCPAVKSAGSVKSACVIEVVAIDENSAVGYVRVVVVNNSGVMPIVSPMMPTPSKPTEETDPKAESKLNARTS